MKVESFTKMEKITNPPKKIGSWDEKKHGRRSVKEVMPTCYCWSPVPNWNNIINRFGSSVSALGLGAFKTFRVPFRPALYRMDALSSLVVTPILRRRFHTLKLRAILMWDTIPHISWICLREPQKIFKKITTEIPQSWWIFHWEYQKNQWLNKPRIFFGW